MTRYRAGTIERVQAAQAIQNRVNGVAAVQPAREKVESVAEFVARGGVIERLPSCGNMFPFDPLEVVPHGWIAKGEINGAKQDSVVRGDSHYATKIKAEQREPIRQRIKAGESQASIARELGVSAATINFIARGRRRKSCSTN